MSCAGWLTCTNRKAHFTLERTASEENHSSDPLFAFLDTPVEVQGYTYCFTKWDFPWSPCPEQGSRAAFQEALQRSVVCYRRATATRVLALENIFSIKISMWMTKYCSSAEIKCSFSVVLTVPIRAPRCLSHSLRDALHLRARNKTVWDSRDQR